MVDLLVAMGLRVVRLPSRGIAERGLDIAAVGRIDDGPRTLFLIQVKQGDVTRAVWNQGQNSVRASLDDLEDYAEEALDLAGHPAPERTAIVIAHSGMVAPNVQSAFNARRRRIQRGGIDVEHWHLHKLVELFEAHLFDEHFFSLEQAALIRKTLAFIEVPEYDLRHLSRFLTSAIPTKRASLRSAERTLLQIQIALAMVYHYGTVEGRNHDVSLRAYEVSLLTIYRWLHQGGLLAQKRLSQHLARLVNTYFVVTFEYFVKLDPLLAVYHGLARTGWHETVEYPLRVLKIGALAGQWMIFLGRLQNIGQLSDELKAAFQFMAAFLERLRGSCPPVERPLFDHQMTDVCLFAIGLGARGTAATRDYLESVVSRIYLETSNGHPIPEGNGDFEAVTKLVMENTVIERYGGSSSTLLTMLAEMCALLDLEALYGLIRKTWTKNVNFQNIYLNGNFVEWACGVGYPVAPNDERVETSIQLPERLEDFRAEIDRKRPLDSELGQLARLPFFELIMHVASRTHSLRLSPLVWRALRAPASAEGGAASKEGSSGVL